MKRIIGLLLCLCTVFGMCFALTSCFHFSPGDLIIRGTKFDENGFGVYGNSLTVIPYDATGDEDKVLIPDTVNGIEIREILDPMCKPCGENIIGGDVFGKDWTIDVEERYVDEIIDERTFNLTLVVGDKLRSASRPNGRVFYKQVSENEYIKYIVKIVWECSENNPNLYANAGHLYYKSGDKSSDILID